MILGMDHTGFIVKDIDKSVAFYEDVIGLEVTRNIERDGDAPHLVTRLNRTMLVDHERRN